MAWREVPTILIRPLFSSGVESPGWKPFFSGVDSPGVESPNPKSVTFPFSSLVATIAILVLLSWIERFVARLCFEANSSPPGFHTSLGFAKTPPFTDTVPFPLPVMFPSTELSKSPPCFSALLPSCVAFPIRFSEWVFSETLASSNGPPSAFPSTFVSPSKTDTFGPELGAWTSCPAPPDPSPGTEKNQERREEGDDATAAAPLLPPTKNSRDKISSDAKTPAPNPETTFLLEHRTRKEFPGVRSFINPMRGYTASQQPQTTPERHKSRTRREREREIEREEGGGQMERDESVKLHR
ncbi:hypothetical protein Taro_040575 [Colocasia esculenta]|uniref:Uncharacterized protein n=1 Tax=Colocasia esculenta TaxID=4460 RepID=A0A843WMA2_COLES|nr:hypothetical protein [Colocasia esculenta]